MSTVLPGIGRHADLADQTAASARAAAAAASRTRRAVVAAGVATALGVGGIGLAGLSAVASAATDPVTVNVDIGGSGLTAPDGTVWSADKGFSGGTVGSTRDKLSCSTSSAVVKTYRYGMSGYKVAVPNGDYVVTFVLAEPYWKAAGKRVFSATAEGTTAFSNLDIYAAVGHDKELRKTVQVSVQDGVLDVGFSAKVNNAIASGIVVTPASAPTTPAPAPTTSSPAPAPTTSSPAPAPTTSSPAPAPTTSSPAPAPTTSSPAPAPTTSSPAPVTSESALRFRPPALVNPVTMAFPEGGATVKLDVTKDYILTLPANRPLVNTKGLTITGGRNVVIIGGVVDVRDGDATTGARRGAYLSKATPNGTTFIEGVRFISSTQGSLTEGIDLASPTARVVLQNVAIDGVLSGSYATNHADMIQAWAGPAVLDIDGFSATTSYQGFFLLPNQHDASLVKDWSLNRMSLTGTDSAYMLWRDNNTAGYTIRTSDVYVSGSHIANGGLWPNASYWPGVNVGKAPAAYAATAGLDYVSPGYR